jgi:DNA-binding CsgD family transcriptional regulator
MPQDEVKPPTRELTKLQLECLEGFWNRKTAKRIAVELDISEAWVNKNLLGIRKQLNVNSTAEAAAIVFGAKAEGTKNYYYQKTDVSRLALAEDQALALADAPSSSVAASEQALLNRFGPLATIVAIFVVGLGAIIGVSLLIVVAQGMNQLWKALGH